MVRAIRVPREEVLVPYAGAYCEDCGSGRGIFEGENKEFGCGFYNPENEKLVGKTCSCGGIIVRDSGFYTYHRGGYIQLNCDCGNTFSIYRDGQQCSCGQMYNAVGQPITHRGYDAYGDTDDWDY